MDRRRLVAVVIVALLVAGLVVNKWLQHSAHEPPPDPVAEAWRALAARSGMRYDPGSHSLEGSYGSATLRVSLRAGPTRTVVACTEAVGELGALHARPAGDQTQDDDAASPVRTGDPLFDHAFVVRAASDEVAARVLTPAARRTLVALRARRGYVALDRGGDLAELRWDGAEDDLGLLSSACDLAASACQPDEAVALGP